MKNLKVIFSSLLLLLLGVCQFNSLQASNKKTALPVYQSVIKEISLGYEDAMLAGVIKLDNGLIMRIVDYKTRDDNVMNTWRAGDAVAFKADLKDEALILSVKRLHEPDHEKVEAYVIFDVIESPENGLKIVEINDDGKFVKLSDDSVWEFGWYNRLSTKRWSVGERVIVFGLAHHNSYEFINLDAPVSKNAYSANGAFVVR